MFANIPVPSGPQTRRGSDQSARAATSYLTAPRPNSYGLRLGLVEFNRSYVVTLEDDLQAIAPAPLTPFARIHSSLNEAGLSLRNIACEGARCNAATRATYHL